ncbi:hypothetical protein [Paenibacillus sp. FJAT-27812]|uniref:hypothetical protein n=1 Tax=Paenibacillus sp. FJAT-27812 TaxID=1684143 RepID=UPI0006A7BC1C|nr:hypothetical protein [Paenibacillus sp. FJAT-27812]
MKEQAGNRNAPEKRPQVKQTNETSSMQPASGLPMIQAMAASNLSQAQLLSWQQTLGNSQTQQLMQRMPSPQVVTRDRAEKSSLPRSTLSTGSSRGVVQRVLSEIRPNEDFKSDENPNNIAISDVLIAGRTPSPFTATMGAHSTAWVAHLDAVRRQLIGYLLDEACKYIINFAKAQQASPLLRLSAHLEEAHKKKLDDANIGLNTAVSNVEPFCDEKNIIDSFSVIVQLQKLISALLTFVNYLPMATVAGGNPGGNGEGSARELLNLYESASSANEFIEGAEEEKKNAESMMETEDNAELAEESIQEHERTIQYYEKVLADIKKDNKAVDLKKKPQLKTKVQNQLRKLFAAETPGVFAQSRVNSQNPVLICEVWALGLQHFLDTIRVAYPYSYEFAEWNQEKQLTEELRLLLIRQNDAEEVEQNFKLSGSNDEAYQIIYDLLRGKRAFQNLGGTNNVPIEDVLAKQAEPVAVAIGPSDFISENSGTLMSTVFLDESGKIGDVLIKGRTKSPFSSTEGMGAHSTAWTAHIDAVRTTMTGKTPKAAARALESLALEAFASSAYTVLKDQVDGKQAHMLGEAEGWLRKLLDQEIDFSNLQSVIAHLQQLIYAYLDFVNVTPLSTVVTGGVPGGRNEGRHRKLLLSFEDNQPIVSTKLKKQLQEALYGLFDPNAIDRFSPDSDKKGGDIDNLEAKKWLYGLNTLLHTLKAAYPKAYKAANFDEYILNQLDAPVEVDMVTELDRKEQEKEDKKDQDVLLSDLQDRETISQVLRARSWNIGQKVQVSVPFKGLYDTGYINGRLNEQDFTVKVQFIKESPQYMQMVGMDVYQIDQVRAIV